MKIINKYDPKLAESSRDEKVDNIG